MKKTIAWILAICLMMSFAFAETAEQTTAEETTGDSAETTGESGALLGPAAAATSEELENLAIPDRIINTVITKPFYEGVTNEEKALEAMGTIMEEIGADDTCVLGLDVIRPTEEGLTYYIFRQYAGDIAVSHCAAKLIVNAKGTAVGATASICPGLPDLSDVTWNITAEDAEKIVAAAVEGENMKIMTGLTHQTLLPADGINDVFLAWVVYTDNPWKWTECAYLAHYVNDNGDYIDCIPVTEPESPDARGGTFAALAFSGLEETSWTGTVTLFDGRQQEITVPTLTDRETGAVYLGDMKRKIVCADCTKFSDEDELDMIRMEDGRFDDGDVLTLAGMIKVWDFYDRIGWTGPDGEGTPMLLLMNWVDEDGEPVANACYAGKNKGFQTFKFNRKERDGECLDLLTHEFTHCVSTTMMAVSLYCNDSGAINEGISDIMGNLAEGMLTEDADPTWLIGEGSRDPGMVIRSMSNPHLYGQPGFVWDLYYIPAANSVKDSNDAGGVHGNSSLLNLIAWRLHEKGMPEEDEFYFWMNVIMALTPNTDYPLIAELLPWCLEQTGFGKWADTLAAAIEETNIKETVPTRMPEGAAVFFCDMPGNSGIDPDRMEINFYNEDGDLAANIWPDARYNTVVAVVPARSYQIVLNLLDENEESTDMFVFDGEGWLPLAETVDMSNEDLTGTFGVGVYDIPAYEPAL